MAILSSRSTMRERSASLPSTFIASAALARPGPIEAAISAPLTGLSNDRTEPSGKEMLIMATTEWENFEHGSCADTERRRQEAGKRHECARPAESSSNGGREGWSGEKPAFHGPEIDVGEPRVNTPAHRMVALRQR